MPNETPTDVTYGLWDKTEAATYLGTTPTYINNLCKDKKIKYTTVANKRMFKKEWLDEYAEKLAVEPTE